MENIILYIFLSGMTKRAPPGLMGRERERQTEGRERERILKNSDGEYSKLVGQSVE